MTFPSRNKSRNFNTFFFKNNSTSVILFQYNYNFSCQIYVLHVNNIYIYNKYIQYIIYILVSNLFLSI